MRAPGAGARTQSSRDSAAALTLPARAGFGQPAGDPFGAKIAAAPPAPSSVPSPPAALKPANPYKFGAVLVQDGVGVVFLAKGDRVYEVKQGEELDGGYRVESIGADQVVLLYVADGSKDVLALPLGAPQADTMAAAPAPAPAAAAASPAAASLGAGDDGPARLRWEGPSQVRAGASFQLALRLSSGQSLRASPMQLSFPPGVVEPVDVRAGKFFGGGSFSYRVNPDGAIFIGASGQGATPGADAELLVVTFRPIKPGATAEIGLTALSLQGPAGRALAHTQVSTFKTAIQ